MNVPPPRNDFSTTYEIGLLAVISIGVIVLLGIGVYGASKSQAIFDPSAYLVVLTLIVGAIKERWLSRSVDRMGQKLADSAPSAPEPEPAPKDAATGARQAADAADDKATDIEAKAKP